MLFWTHSLFIAIFSFLIIFNDTKVDIAQVCWWRLYDIKLWVKCVIEHWNLEFFHHKHVCKVKAEALFWFIHPFTILCNFYWWVWDMPHKGYWWGLCPTAWCWWEQLTQKHLPKLIKNGQTENRKHREMNSDLSWEVQQNLQCLVKYLTELSLRFNQRQLHYLWHN